MLPALQLARTQAGQIMVSNAEHRPPRGQRDARPDPHPEEKAIVTAAPVWSINSHGDLSL